MTGRLVIHGDAAHLPLADSSIDAVVCDPPYGLGKAPDVAEVLRHWLAGDDYHATGGGFMGKAWDSFVPGPATWREIARVLKPGGHLLAFAGARTFDLMGLSIRLAGFEVRDALSWLYGSGFPKSMDPTKYGAGDQWAGWGTALKPAWEPVIMARNPMPGTVVDNLGQHGTGGLHIDACRVSADDEAYARNHSGDRGHAGTRPLEDAGATDLRPGGGSASTLGRWPANVLLDEEAAALLDAQAPDTGAAAQASGPTQSGPSSSVARNAYAGTDEPPAFYGDTGGASRFYYVAKPSRSERNLGLHDFPEGEVLAPNGAANAVGATRGSLSAPRANVHPTVKPVDLMRWLVRLVTPPGGIVLDPFLGSGTTGRAAEAEGFRFVGVEREAEYVAIAAARLAHPMQRALFT